tara:strand:+ start:135 stop:1190 length:1056 start_codon:yes stop_codon:yes gene_type:complete
MSIFEKEIISGRISYDELSDVDVSEFTEPFLESLGVVFQYRKYLPYKAVFYGEGGEENPARADGSSSSNIKDLAESRRRGIILDSARPIVELNNIVDVSGKTYNYKGEDGVTRYKADQYNGQTDGGDVFDVVSYVDTYDEEGNLIHTAAYNRLLYLQKLNDSPPREVHNVKDLVSTCATLIAGGHLPKEELAIRHLVYAAAPNLSTAKKNEVIRQVLKDQDVPTQTRSWRDNECWDWYETKCVDKDEVKIDYFFPNHYFQDRIYSVLKQFAENEEVQTLAEHVNNKGDNPEIVQSRREHADLIWEEARKVFEKVSKYMVCNNFKLPIERSYWMPQIQSGDDEENRNKFVHR